MSFFNTRKRAEASQAPSAPLAQDDMNAALVRMTRMLSPPLEELGEVSSLLSPG
jgi:hypothetical protein